MLLKLYWWTTLCRCLSSCFNKRFEAAHLGWR